MLLILKKKVFKMNIINNSVSSNVDKVNASKIGKHFSKQVAQRNKSSEEYKSSLYPQGYSPLLPHVLEQKKRLKSGKDIIKELKLSDKTATCLLKETLIDIYDENLDNYTQQINSFDLDDDKKLFIIFTIASNYSTSSVYNVLPQTARLCDFFSNPNVQNKLKETDLNDENMLKLTKLPRINIGNFDDKTFMDIIWQDNYDWLPINVINYIGTLSNPKSELQTFSNNRKSLDNIFTENFPPNVIEFTNGKLLYDFLNLMINTNKNSDCETLQYRDLIFYRDFLENFLLPNDNYLSTKCINNAFLNLRPQLAVKVVEGNVIEELIKEKLENVKRIIQLKTQKATPQQKKALNNILNIQEGLKYLDIENININKSTIEQNETLNYIFKAIPELYNTIGKTQIGHTYTLDKHILSVAQHVVRNKEYENLDENNKKLLLIAALMHDITKKEGGQDPSHPQSGAEFAYDFLKNVFDKEECSTIANLIYNHHFNSTISKDSEERKFSLAYECAIDKNKEFIKMLKILGQADLEGNPRIRDLYLNSIPTNVEKLEAKVMFIQQTLNKLKTQLELTPFPEKTSSEKKESIEETLKSKGIIKEYIISENGKKLPIIDLTKIKEVEDEQQQKIYFEHLGFEKNTTCKSLNLLVHAIQDPNHIDGIEKIVNSYKQDAILSASNITLDKPFIFEPRYCGFVFNSEDTNVLDYSYINLLSGNFKKRFQINYYLNNSIKRTEEETEKIKSKLKNRKNHSEIITTDISVGAVFIKAKNYNETTKTTDPLLVLLVDYAKKHEIPVILIPYVDFEL